jgi:hypothetical protein
MKRVFVSLICLTISIVTFGQDKPAPVAAVSEIPPGPSMKETETWIKRELRGMGSDHIITKYKDTTWGTNYEIDGAVLSECRLTLRTSEQEDASFGITPKRRTQIATVTLKDVDVGKLQSKEIPVVPEATMSKPSYRIIVSALSDRGDPFLLESDGYAGGKATKPVRVVGVRVREQSMGNRGVEVFRRAAILCGAPSQSAELSGDELGKVSGRYNRKEKTTDYIELKPDGTFTILEDGETGSGNYKVNGTTLTLTSPGMKEPLKARLIGDTIGNDQGVVRWEKPAPPRPAGSETAQEAPSETSKPGSPAASRMTNEEVIQLVAAGLSEQVIVTSIRQAPTKDFDLSPAGLIALKKANVPDAVIVVMQEKGTPEQTSSATDTKTPPKYDATLTKQTAPPPQNGCSGIESMGVFKNTVMDPAIGGGVVEWLAKIRNNTNVTKIVVFGWIDMYGQQKKAQVQIRGGDIASVRLDLTQARVIPPVRDVRVLSCQ